MLSAEDVLTFWFTECTPEDWFGGKPEFDARLSARFTETHRHVALGEAYGWRTSAQGRLAEIIVLDQFSRQLHRNSLKAFAQDGMALALAQELVAQKLDATLTAHQPMFAYMPYTHSESCSFMSKPPACSQRLISPRLSNPNWNTARCWNASAVTPNAMPCWLGYRHPRNCFTFTTIVTVRSSCKSGGRSRRRPAR
jgi:uncharacterized protein (DUF924 family)